MESRKIGGSIINDTRVLDRDLSFLTVAMNLDEREKHRTFRDQGIKNQVNWLGALRKGLRSNADELKLPFPVSKELFDSNKANSILYFQGELVHNAHSSNHYK